MKQKSFNMSANNAENQMQLSGAKVAVLGAARSGIALARLLAKAGAQVLLSEYKSKSEIETVADLPNVAVEFGGHSEKVLDANLICISPGIPLDIPILQTAKEKNIPQIGELEAASWFCDAPMIAITGSNGKTTTTTLIGEMYRAFFQNVIVGGNIGIPFSELVFTNTDLTPGPSPSRRREQESPPLLEGEGDLGGEVRARPIRVTSAKKIQNPKDARFAIVEVSSFQLETIINFKPSIAIITNFSPNHLDRYPSYEDYISAKLAILKNMTAANVLIYNDDDSLLREKVKNVNCRKMPFSNQHALAEGGFWENDTMHISWQGKNWRIPVEKTALRGSHNRYNMVAAAMAAVLNDIPVEVIQNVLENASPIEHRLENVATIDDVVYVNDSKATSVLALECALKSFSQPLVLIAGGKDKGGDFSDLNNLLKEKVRAVVVIGEAATRMTIAWQNILPVHSAETLEAAVYKASEIAESGDAVLLSPACSSFDMFENFEQRGKKFKEIVKKIDLTPGPSPGRRGEKNTLVKSGAKSPSPRRRGGLLQRSPFGKGVRSEPLNIKDI